MTGDTGDLGDGRLVYHVYCSGAGGLGNTIMSIEVGLILAFLTRRVLVLEANQSPTANLVDYGDRLRPAEPSRVTDLFEMPHPWLDAADLAPSDLEGVELTEWPLQDSVFFFPQDRDVRCFDARAFARGRTHFVTYHEAARRAPVLRLSGGPPVGPDRYLLGNFGFYSYLFYLDEPTRRAVHGLLAAMRPRAPFADLAAQIASDLGSFHAVHVRRGDFKRTPGRTTCLRRPSEVVAALEPHFDRQTPLAILTDEADDPFFGEILEAYPGAFFVDRLLLERYASSVDALPHRDPIALAFVSQLVATHARDFVGTFTSTFTALIQRYRGNRGLTEDFKFLWNELPEEGVPLQPGTQPINECVPLENGVMVEEYQGPYSWNRVHPRIAAAWMREWPEAFLSSDPA